ncbi:MAG: laminin G domain-containing protein [Armatimonadota bacterium]
MKGFIQAGLALLAITTLHSSAVIAAPANEPIPAQWKTIVAGNQSESERLATVDLQRYLGQVTKVVPTIMSVDAWKLNPCPAVVLGTPDGNPLVDNMTISGKKLGVQGFYLSDASTNGIKTVVAAGSTAEGATNAIYGLLRELGYRFYLGSESAPESLPNNLPDRRVTKKPVFSMRGVLPWYNFFNSPTTWDPVDHRAFVDQLVRMGANFVGFHTYDGEPFGGYEEDGKMVWSDRLLNTGAPTWGTSPLPANDFGFGTGMLYSEKFFGAASTTNIADRNEAIKAEQNIMRDALDYAKKRGLHPCIGFEMWGNPLNPKDRDVFLKRLNHLLDKYPSAEYIWIWQAETQGAQGYPEQYNMHHLPYALDPQSHLPLYGAARRDIFHRVVHETKGQPPYFQDNGIGEAARANEGARLEQYAQLALHTFKHRAHSPKLVISGWGGEQRIMSAEYYDGLDELLPDDVVFSSLDFISPLPHVDSIYGQLPVDRQRWPIPWLENDGDQWQPQPYVHLYESTVKDAHKGGSQGILGIHWRTREIEENFGYLVSYAWNPGMTADEFYKDLARNCYSADIADEMADIHIKLDNMGYRWVGGGGQGECAPFTWGPGEEDKAKQLQAIRDRASSLLPKAGKGKDRLEWLLTNMDWVLEYRKAEVAAIEAKNLLGQATNSDPAKTVELANKALDVLKEGDLGRAMRTYARRVTTRGEYGVLATINTKAYVDWQNIVNDALRKSGKSADVIESAPWNPEPDILLPRLITSAETGKQLELAPVVLGGRQAWIHYRPLGESKWNTKMLEDNNRWVKKAVIEASSMTQPGIETGFSFNSDPSQQMAYGPITITVSPKTRVNTRPAQILKGYTESKIKLSFKNNPAVPIELVWNDVPDVDYYRVYRDGKAVVDTAVPMFPDNPINSDGEYTVEGIRDGKVIVKSESIRYTKKTQSVIDRFNVDAKVNASGVLLRWPATKSKTVTSYKVVRAQTSDTTQSQILTTVKAARGTVHTFRDLPTAGKWAYSIIPVNITGQEGKPQTVSVDFVEKRDIKPSTDLPLNVKPQGVDIVGEVSFGDSGAVLQGGYMLLPHKDSMNMGNSMTLSFEFKADDIQGMPVILSHGAWQQDGWFVQILNGSFIIRTPKGDASGPYIQPGVWYKVFFGYDGAIFLLKVNDQWYDQGAAQIVDVPANRQLIIGQYPAPSPQFIFRGTIRNIKIYNDLISQ